MRRLGCRAQEVLELQESCGVPRGRRCQHVGLEQVLRKRRPVAKRRGVRPNIASVQELLQAPAVVGAPVSQAGRQSTAREPRRAETAALGAISARGRRPESHAPLHLSGPRREPTTPSSEGGVTGTERPRGWPKMGPRRVSTISEDARHPCASSRKQKLSFDATVDAAQNALPASAAVGEPANQRNQSGELQDVDGQQSGSGKRRAQPRKPPFEKQVLAALFAEKVQRVPGKLPLTGSRQSRTARTEAPREGRPEAKEPVRTPREDAPGARLQARRADGWPVSWHTRKPRQSNRAPRVGS